MARALRGPLGRGRAPTDLLWHCHAAKVITQAWPMSPRGPQRDRQGGWHERGGPVLLGFWIWTNLKALFAIHAPRPRVEDLPQAYCGPRVGAFWWAMFPEQDVKSGMSPPLRHVPMMAEAMVRAGSSGLCV